MQLRAILLLSLAVLSLATPVQEAGDLVAAEGHNPHAYASAPAPRYGGGATVTSFHRRGSYAQAGDLHKPTIYGSSYGAPRSHAPYPAPAAAGAYGPAPGAYQTPSHASGAYQASSHASGAYQAPSHAPGAYQASSPAHQGYAPPPRSYGPPRNAFSEHSQRVSHDPHYDSSKDPVSQYAQYIPVFEYAPKASSAIDPLSIYGYRK